MSQYARNNPDQPPVHEAFGGGAFSSQAACFRAAKFEMLAARAKGRYPEKNIVITLEREPMPDDYWFRATLPDGTVGEWVFGQPLKALESLLAKADFYKP